MSHLTPPTREEIDLFAKRLAVGQDPHRAAERTMDVVITVMSEMVLPEGPDVPTPNSHVIFEVFEERLAKHRFTRANICTYPRSKLAPAIQGWYANAASTTAESTTGCMQLTGTPAPTDPATAVEPEFTETMASESTAVAENHAEGGKYPTASSTTARTQLTGSPVTRSPDQPSTPAVRPDCHGEYINGGRP